MIVFPPLSLRLTPRCHRPAISRRRAELALDQPATRGVVGGGRIAIAPCRLHRCWSNPSTDDAGDTVMESLSTHTLDRRFGPGR